MAVRLDEGLDSWYKEAVFRALSCGLSGRWAEGSSGLFLLSVEHKERKNVSNKEIIQTGLKALKGLFRKSVGFLKIIFFPSMEKVFDQIPSGPGGEEVSLGQHLLFSGKSSNRFPVKFLMSRRWNSWMMSGVFRVVK